VVAYFVLGVVVAGIMFGILASTRWAARRGWVYNRHNPRPNGGGVPAAAFGRVFKPELEYVVEEMQSEQIRAERDDSGRDPD
jgi:hypothetical protein